MRYPIRQLAEIVQGKLLNEPQDATIEHVLLDSRQVIFPESSVFIALQGRRHDGHEFIEDLYKSGVRNFIVSSLIPPRLTVGQDSSFIIQNLPSANFILVQNTHEAFHRLAAFHRRQFDLPVIGITGSNGKTIVKEWLYQLLQEDYHVVRSPKSYNSQTGVPLSVLQIMKEHNLGIFEAGISKMGEMEKLAPIIEPAIGIFTNIGEAHSEGFPDIETKLRQKLILFENAKTVIYCRDDERVDKAVGSWQSQRDKSIVGSQERRCFTWSAKGKDADLQVFEKREEVSKTIIAAKVTRTSKSGSVSFPDLEVRVTIPFTDAASIENAIHCWALMLYLGYDHETISRRMAKLEPVAMRLELKEGVNGCIIVNDSYNSDLTSLNIALNFLEQQSKTERRTLVLSDILQSGQPPEKLYGTVANLLFEKKIDRFIGIGEEVGILQKLLDNKAQKKQRDKIEANFFKSTPDFLENFHRLAFRDETILLKGARHFEFERIANRLAVKTHNTTLEVNLTALLHNLRVYQSHLRPGTKLLVMVKASAYGSGSAEVAKLLEFQHVDYLGVAYADEGVELRKAGVQLPILVMNPEEATFDALVRYNLEPEIYNLRLLEKFLRFLITLPPTEGEFNSPSVKTVAIHLKLDTGMHRLGFTESDLDAVLSHLLPLTSYLSIRTIFTHLAASESPAHDDFTRQQAERFQKMYEKLAAELSYRPLRHILNSGGIVRFPEYQMDMVRLGIGLYGIDSSKLIQDKLQTVNTLKATISQTKEVKAGETVGYGRMGKAEKALRIATLSLGYADGLLRQAGNGRFSVLIHGKRAPLFGNVCMDMVMADITDIPEAEEGDTVVIFGKALSGEELPVEELAACLDTIPYEIFTTISERVKRVYVQE